MMEYEIFKEVVTARIQEFLPPVFGYFDVEVREVPKTNGTREAIVMSLEGYEHKMAAPTIYLDDLYSRFTDCNDLESVLEEAAMIILNFTGALAPELAQMDMSEMKGQIIATVINTERNEELLAMIPHREWMDLSVVYRFIVDKGDDSGYAAALVTNEVLKDLELSERELETLAQDNSRELLRTEVLHLAPDLHVMTTDLKLFGASILLRNYELEKLAKELNDDLYLVPSSIHEVMAIPAKDADLKELITILEDGNKNYIEQDEFLSDNIYLYSLEKNTVEYAAKEG